MSVKSELAKYGSGVGYIYLTDLDDNIEYQMLNNENGRLKAETLMLVSSSLISNISASGTITVTNAGGGTITNLSYNGVSIFNTATPIGGATESDMAANIALAVNSHISVPNYTAVSSGATVTVYLDSEQGDSLNGTALASSVTSPTTITSTALDGGSYPTTVVDAQLGYKMYLNASTSAALDTIVGATDVTSGVLRKSSASPYSVKDVEISSGSVSIDRDGAMTVVNVQTEGAVAADDLTSIDAGIFSDGDTIIVRGKEVGKVTTVTEGGNIELANNADFLTGNKDSVIILQFSVSDNKWYEISRSPGNDLSVSSLRSAGISVPVQGVEVFPLTAGGGTVNLTAGVDKGVHVITGVVTLSGSWGYNLNNGVVDGDTFYIMYKGQVNLNGNTLNIAGISLTADQAANADVAVKAVWSSASSAWSTVMIKDTSGIDLVDTTDLAAKEDSLGNPVSNGYVLSSTTGGVRSWVANNTDVVLDGNGTTSGNSAGVETTLRTINIPAGLLSNLSSIIVETMGEFGANANAKNLRVYLNGTLIGTNTSNTNPNGVSFQNKTVITRVSGLAKCSTSTMISGGTGECSFSQISGLTFDTTSYDITITGEGSSASDVVVYASIANKFIV